MKKRGPFILCITLLLLAFLLFLSFFLRGKEQAASSMAAISETPQPTAEATARPTAQPTPQPTPTTDPACIIELKKGYFKEKYGESQQPPTEDDLQFEKFLLDVAQRMYVPDLRKGERCSPPSGRPDHNYPHVYLLASFPEHDVYLFGYADETHIGRGLILDTGSKQTIHAFPNCWYYPYSNEGSNPCTLSEDGKTLYFIDLSTTIASPISIDTITVFDLTGTEPTAEDITMDIADAFTAALSMQFNSATQEATLLLDGKELYTGRLDPDIGFDTGDYHPDTFDCWERVGGVIDKNGIIASCVATPVDLHAPFFRVENEVPVYASVRKVDGKWELYDLRLTRYAE